MQDLNGDRSLDWIEKKLGYKQQRNSHEVENAIITN